MHQIREALKILDLIVGTWWGVTFMDILPHITAKGILGVVASDALGFFNFLVVVAGLVYLVVRIVHFVRMSKLHIEYKRQEIIEKQNANFYRKFTGEFLDPFKEK
jgi:hypothetical protein